MKKTLTIIILFLHIVCYSQEFDIDIRHEYEWANWRYTSIEFNNDCTILNGYVRGENDFYTCFDDINYLECNGEKYKLLDSTIIKEKKKVTPYDKGSWLLDDPVPVAQKCYSINRKDLVHFSFKYEPLLVIDSFFLFCEWPEIDTIKNIHINKGLSQEEKIKNLKVYLEKIKMFEYGSINYYHLRYVNQYVKNLDGIEDNKWKDSLFLYFDPIKSLMSKPISAQAMFSRLRLSTDYLISILRRLEIEDKYKNDFNNVYKICDLLDSIQVYKDREIPEYEKFYVEGNELLDRIEGGLYYRNCFSDDTMSFIKNRWEMEIFKDWEYIDNDTISIFEDNIENYDSILKIKTHWRLSFLSESALNSTEEIELRNVLLAYFEHKYGKSSYYYLSILMLNAQADEKQGKYEDALNKFEYIEHQLVTKESTIRKEQESVFDFLGNLRRKYDDLYNQWYSCAYKRSVCYMKTGDIEKARKISPLSPDFMLRATDSLDLIKHCRSVRDERIDNLSKSIDENHLFDIDFWQTFSMDALLAPDNFTKYAINTKNTTIIKYAFEEWLNISHEQLYREKKIKYELKEHKNKQLKKMLDSLITLEKKNDYYYTNNINNTESVKTVKKIKDIQKIIAQKISNGEINAINKWVKIEEISKRLSDSSIAIIVEKLTLFESDTTIYVAISVDNKNHVDIKMLCEKQLLDSLGNTFLNRLYDSDFDNKLLLDKMYLCFWGPMNDWISNKKNIYLSLNGSVALFPVESAILSHDNYNSNKHYYRLTSLLELLENYQESSKKAALYGGLDYNNTNNCIEGINSEMVLAHSKSLKGSLGDIRIESQNEINQIYKILKSSGIPCDSFINDKGTEKSIKSLSGSDVTNLHISTHGFYVSDSLDLKKNRSFLRPKKSELSSNDVNLKKTGLLMSGSSNSYYKSPSSFVEEDGILTAKEISLLDFSNIDLVVLSACQTGVGDIISSNVYGLQLGFKKAGAKSVLMTLWEVDDAATTIFMVEFYKNLFQLKKSKYESLISAQKYLKDYRDENGVIKYESPEYWAGFVLLDGFD